MWGPKQSLKLWAKLIFCPHPFSITTNGPNFEFNKTTQTRFKSSPNVELSWAHMASLALPFRLTASINYSKSNSRFHFSTTGIGFRASTRFSTNSMSQPAGTESLPSQEQDKEDSVKAENSDVLVQYVVLRRDLIDTWPLGSVVTQGCHASVFAIWSNKDDPHTLQYCSPQNIDSMHKVNPSFSSLIWAWFYITTLLY